MKKLICLVAGIASLAMLTVNGVPAAAQAEPTIKLGYAKCAHCTPLALLPQYAKGVKVEVIGFNTGNDVFTALVSKSIDVGQVTYLHYAVGLDKGFDVVAISGQVNGGSAMLVTNDLPVTPEDWGSLKKVIADYKAAGKPFRVAASRGKISTCAARSPSRVSTSTRTFSSSIFQIHPIIFRRCGAGKSS